MLLVLIIRIRLGKNSYLCRVNMCFCGYTTGSRIRGNELAGDVAQVPGIGKKLLIELALVYDPARRPRPEEKLALSAKHSPGSNFGKAREFLAG